MKNGDSSGSCYANKLSICNLGMALGIVWGLIMFLAAILSFFFGIGMPIVEIFGTIYWGFDASLIGAVLGLLWGFIAGFIIGALVAFFYNYCATKCPCTTCKTNRNCCK